MITTAQVLTATVTISGGSGNPVATGTVLLSGGGYSSGSVALSGGSAAINVPAGSLAAGTDTLTAAYTPDTNSATTYNSSSGSATVRVTPLPLATPAITVAVSPANVAISQAVTVRITVAGTAGNPAPTGLVTLMSNNPAPMIYDTFQYPDGTLLNGKTAQSGNSVWSVGGNGVIEGNHLINNAPPDQLGTMTAMLPNTTSVGGTPQPVTTVGGTIRMCPSASGTYDPSYTSVGMIAFHDYSNVIEIGIGPTSWWLTKEVNGVGTTLLEGTENLAVDCTSEYTVQMMINQAAGTLQVIPPSGIPSPVITDPDITQIDALYGDWEPENNAPYKYVGEWGSVWLGGGYVSASTPLIGGSATITVPAGSLALGTDTLTATYIPDTDSSPIYNGEAGTGSVAVSKVIPSVMVTPSSTSITTIQEMTVTVAVSGGTGAPVPTGTVVLSGGGYTSSAVTLTSGSATIRISAEVLAAGTDTLTATYTPDATSSATYNAVARTASVAVSKLTPSVKVTPSSTSITMIQGVTVTLAVSGGTGAPVPTGTVALSGSGYTSSAVTLTSGSATIQIQAGVLAAGTDTLTTTYTPDSTSLAIYNGAAEAASVAVSKLTPSMKVTSSSTNITTIQGVTVTLAVSGGIGAPVPTGTVMLSGSKYTSSAVTLTSGSAMIRIPAGILAAGTDTLTATYTPNTTSSAIFNAATGTTSVAVNKLTPSMTVTPSSMSITLIQGVTVTVAVSGGTGAPVPTGTVVLSGSGYTSSAVAATSGSATIRIPAGVLAAGTHTLTATYKPDATSGAIYNAVAATASVAVSKLTPSLIATIPSSRITTTQLFQVLVTVTGGTVVQFPRVQSRSPLAGMDRTKWTSPTVLRPSLFLRVHCRPPPMNILFSYSGDSIYSGALATGRVTVMPSTVSVSLTPANNGTFVSSLPETVSIIVTGTGPAPAGTVTLTGGGFSSPATKLVSGSATITIPANQFTNAGNIALSASYSGDAIYASGYGGKSIIVNAPYSLTTTNPSPVSPGTDTVFDRRRERQPPRLWVRYR